MTLRAFKDAGDGYYQVEIADGDPIPDWASAQGWTEIPVKPLIEELQLITIQMWQARAALDIKGLLAAADAAVAASSNPAIRQYWQYATTLDEGNDFTKAFAATIGLTDKQMHDLFVAASEIKLSAK